MMIMNLLTSVVPSNSLLSTYSSVSLSFQNQLKFFFRHFVVQPKKQTNKQAKKISLIGFISASLHSSAKKSQPQTKTFGLGDSDCL